MKSRIIHRDPESLKQYKNNSRTHSSEQIEQIKASITEFGFTNPVLINGKDIVIAGHGRIAAAIDLNIKEIPCIPLKHLTKDQEQALAIADNQLALNAGWDIDILAQEIEGLKLNEFDIDLLGFDDLDSILDSINFDVGTEDDQGQLDELDPIYVACPECGKEFDSRTAKC
ncbi:MAG: ParB N-terminal domain-containing protein [Gammaproteobacteria bacterium]|nr:ParB N-terminal domain-containing protein [Gammaproteobacteria bacterium]